MSGDTRADFGDERMFTLHGPGGAGKSSAVNLPGTAIGGVLTELKPDEVIPGPRSNHDNTVDSKTLLNAASSGMATTADAEVPKGEVLNM